MAKSPDKPDASTEEQLDNVAEIEIEDNTPPEAEPPVLDDLRMPEDTPERGRFRTFISTHRTRVIITIGIILIIPAAAWGYMEYTKPVNQVSKDVTVKKKSVPATTPSPLTGLPVSAEVASAPIVAVVIENHPDARPQSGLQDAGVVYEALAEGGITRFEAFFLDTIPANIGPVRSLRTYFLDWGLEFKSPVVHAGGNADAMDMITPTGMKDINALYGDPSKYFTRSNDRVAPHNLYISGENLNKALVAYKFNQPATFTPSPRTKKDVPVNPPPHPVIHIDYSYTGYQVDYNFDTGCDCYNRNMAGAPHVDRNSGKQIQVKNVVVQYMPTSYGKTRQGEDTVIMGTPGSGKAIVFRDGTAIEGTWKKDSHNSRTQLLDAEGKDIPLNKGNTWYSIVPDTKTVSY